MKNSVGNGTFACTWSIQKDLPVWDIRGEFLQIELYVETRNNSPEAKNDLVLVRDDAVFSSDWDNPLLGGKDEVEYAEEGAGSQGAHSCAKNFGIITGFVLMYQMGRGVLRKNDDENVPPAFEDVWSGLSTSALTENSGCIRLFCQYHSLHMNCSKVNQGWWHTRRSIRKAEGEEI